MSFDENGFLHVHGPTYTPQRMPFSKE
jgi:hypothetical protein